MDTEKYRALKTKTIAHRGLSAIECENTNAAFIAAGNRIYFGIETDVHVTADKRFVIIHDDTMKRVSGEALAVEKSTLGELRAQKLRTADGYSRTDYIVPTLEEYIGICKRYEKCAVLELKNRFSEEDIRRITDIISKNNYLEHTIFISFDLDNLKILRRLLPKQELQYLVKRFSENILYLLKKYKLDIDIHYKALDKKLVKLLKSNGIKINCWTCDNKAEAEKLAKLGVDFITSNILE